MKKRAIFFDTSYFSEAKFEDIKESVSNQDFRKFITSGIYNEIIDGAKNTDKAGFKYILEGNALKKEFQKLDFKNCDKVFRNEHIFKDEQVYLKSLPILCSTYYRWLPFALEPYFLLDNYRHLYNDLQFYIKDNKENQKIYRAMGQLTQDELGKTLDGKRFNPKKLAQARKKKRKDYKDNQINLNDYQLCLGAFIYACAYTTSTVIITCDYDLVDIIENIYRSIINEYAIHNVLGTHLQSNFKQYKFCIGKMELGNELKRLLNMINISMNINDMLAITLIFYDKSKFRCLPYTYFIPLEIAEFFLRDKSNVDCYSLDILSENCSKYRYKVDNNPTKLYFEIFPKRIPFYDGFISNCQSICKYCKQEKNPIEISTFLKK